MDGCVEQTSIRKQSELCIFVTHFSQKRIAALLLLKCLRSEGEGPLFIYLKPSGWKGFCFTLLQRMRAEWQWQPCFPQGRLVAMLINYKRQTDRQTAPQTGRIGHGHTHKGKKRRKKTRGGRKSYTLGWRKIERKRKRSSPRREHSFCTAPASAPATWLWVNTFRHNLSWESETGSLTGINSRGRKKKCAASTAHPRQSNCSSRVPIERSEPSSESLPTAPVLYLLLHISAAKNNNKSIVSNTVSWFFHCVFPYPCGRRAACGGNAHPGLFSLLFPPEQTLFFMNHNLCYDVGARTASNRLLYSSGDALSIARPVFFCAYFLNIALNKRAGIVRAINLTRWLCKYERLVLVVLLKKRQ